MCRSGRGRLPMRTPSCPGTRVCYEGGRCAAYRGLHGATSHVPTMTVYSPKGTNTGVAVVVFPGGGYNGLAIDLEGTEICDWLTSKGITGVLLKYRVPTPKVGRYKESPLALQDAQRTLGLVRFRAAEWHIDPRKIGVIGFSAGGHLVAAISTHFDKRSYPAVDAADQVAAARISPIALYPGHLSPWHPDRSGSVDRHKAIRVQSEHYCHQQYAAHFFVAGPERPGGRCQKFDGLLLALRNAKVPVELHLYAEGGHAFGLRRTKFPITEWPQLVEKWLGTNRDDF